MFDLTAFPGPVTIGIAKRNPDYKLAAKHEYVSKIAAEKRPAQVATGVALVAHTLILSLTFSFSLSISLSLSLSAQGVTTLTRCG